MSTLTRFSELCAAFRLSDAQLRVAIQLDETTRTHARLLRRNTVLLDRIERFVPSSVEELDEMIDFFARRRMDMLQAFTSMPEKMTDLLTRFDRSKLRPANTTPIRFTPLPDPLPVTMEAEALARMVMRAPGRVVAIGPDKRFLAVSLGAAEAYRSTPSRMSGRHLLEVIGCGHYQGRARQKIELAFMGRPQSYEHTPDPMDGTDEPSRIYIRAVEDNSARRYAVLHITA